MAYFIREDGKSKIKIVFHILISLTAFISVGLHIAYSPAPLVSITKFTIHSNFIVAITFLLTSISMLKRKNENRFLDYLKNCSFVYMSVTFLTYHFLLASGGEYEGIRIITNFTIHYLIPFFVFFNWIVFESKQKYSFKLTFYWLIFPVLYTGFSLVRGLFDGFYPYFFLNPHSEPPVGVGSYLNVIFFMIVFFFMYILLGILLILLNRLFLYIKNKYSSSSEQDVSNMFNR